MRYIVWTEDLGEVMFEHVKKSQGDGLSWYWNSLVLRQAWPAALLPMHYYRNPDTPWKKDLPELVKRIKRSRDANLLFARTKGDR